MTLRSLNVLKILLVLLLCASAYSASAATLRLNPNTGVYTVGKTFTISVLLNTEGKAVNASDGQISFNPRELQVVSASRASSIFNLWTEEPTFSNSAGTISFGGGSPSGYKGSGGTIVSIVFRPLGAGTPKVNFTSASVLAADGLGTNVLTSMNGGTYTVAAQADSPAPEYIPPANTPLAPKVTSTTHPEEMGWYREATAKLAWTLPDDVTSIRTLLDEDVGTVPTIVYDERLTEKTIEDLSPGVSYFHIQFKNADGWGRITHYRLAVDTEAPQNFSITEEGEVDVSNPNRTLVFTSEDISPILEYKIQIDGGEPFVYKDEAGAKKYTLESLSPGYHTIVAEAFDSAGNTAIANYSFTIESFEKPKFTEYPTRINTEVIPAIKGITRPNAVVTIRVARANDGSVISVGEESDTDSPYVIMSNDVGEFTFIPDTPFEKGVYVLSATARDTFGRMSDVSEEIRIVVDAPGYVVVGSLVVSILSVLVPLIALMVVLIFGTWYLWHRLVRWKRRVRKETLEAEEELTLAFSSMVKNLNTKIEALKESRKGKLTKAESDLILQIESDLKTAKNRIGKEIEDIEDIVT